MKRSFDMSSLAQATADADILCRKMMLFDILTKTDCELRDAQRVANDHAKILPTVLSEVDKLAKSVHKTKVSTELFDYVLERERKRRRII